MFLGHFGVALGAKRFAPRVSLGLLMLASLLPDLLAWSFVIAGLEHIAIKPGITATNALDLYDIAMSHSLLMDGVWSALLAIAYYLGRRDPCGAWILAMAVLSHWVLDFASHRPDMPLAPGLRIYLGLGLYNSPLGIFAVEGLIWLAGILVYTRGTRAKNRAGAWAFWGIVLLLTPLWIGTLKGAPPPGNIVQAAISSLVFFSLVVAWAFWMNRLRRA